MSNNTIIGAVEIGTAKVVVLIGELVDGRNLNVIGMGQASSHGVKKGEILDFKAVNHCTHAALQAAEESAGTEIESVYLTQTGAHVAGTYNSAVVNVSAPDNRVAADDVSRAVKEARSKKLPEGRVYIHHIGNPFFLDGEIVADPVGMVGGKLEIGFWSVHGEERKISNHVHVVNDYFGAHVDDLIVSGIASASICATDPEKRNGVLVIDVGCGTTDYVLYRNGFIVHTGVVPVGGDHLTNDLSLGLRINRKHAEKLKLQCGKAFVDDKDRGEEVWLMGDQQIGDSRIKRHAIQQIIEARMTELFEIIAKTLGHRLNHRDTAGGVILTGGVSRLPGIDHAAAKVFNLTVRRSQGPDWVNSELRQPEYSAVLGLLHYASTALRRQSGKEETQSPRGLFSKVAQILSING